MVRWGEFGRIEPEMAAAGVALPGAARDRVWWENVAKPGTRPVRRRWGS